MLSASEKGRERQEGKRVFSNHAQWEGGSGSTPCAASRPGGACVASEMPSEFSGLPWCHAKGECPPTRAGSRPLEQLTASLSLWLAFVCTESRRGSADTPPEVALLA